MSKLLKIALTVLLFMVIVVTILGFVSWTWMRSTYLDFEKDYVERTDFEVLTQDGYTFLDRNGNDSLDIYEDVRRSTSDRLDNLIMQMTVEEKIRLLKGSGLASFMGLNKPGEGIPGAAGTIVPIPRLGLPTVYLSDGPAGLRINAVRPKEDRTYYATAFPIATLLASTWDTDLVYDVGVAMGTEAAEYGIDVILAPGANIQRHPLCGRNFEYYSEDPVLSGEIGAAMINGIESKGVGASVKHYVANNQETTRFKNDVRVSQRALREIYLKGFEIIVKKAQPWTVMSSYNKVNGEYVSESRFLLTDILRSDWGFEGLVVTDWFGGSYGPSQISAGNDLLEPGTKRQWKALTSAFESGELSINDINTSARRILKLVLESKKMRGYAHQDDPDLKAHGKLTRQSATEGMTLLKNNNTLPIRDITNIALLGVTSYDFITGGTGSGDVNEAYTISLEDGLINAGFEINFEAKNTFEKHKSANAKKFEKPEGWYAMFNPHHPPEMELNNDQLADIATSADLAIVTIGRNAGEGGDRVIENDFLLSEIEMNLIQNTCEAFHEAGKRVIVVLNVGGVIETASWKDKPDAVLLAWQGGQEGGNSLVDILIGRTNPSGKIPMTFPVTIEDHASHANFPLDGKRMGMFDLFKDRTKILPEEQQVRNEDYTVYEEGVHVGYRHFDKKDLEVSYPFGFGMSYTEFQYSEMGVQLSSDTIDISVVITNAGQMAGKEVVQVYVSKINSNIDRPSQELKAFAKTSLLPPTFSDTVAMHIPISELRYWNEEEDDWTLEKGGYVLRAGASSRDIRLESAFNLQ